MKIVQVDINYKTGHVSVLKEKVLFDEDGNPASASNVRESVQPGKEDYLREVLGEDHAVTADYIVDVVWTEKLVQAYNDERMVG